MATPTYTPLATTTLSAAASSVTFSSIDQSYGDLILVAATSSSSSTNNVDLVLNSDTGSKYSTVSMDGDGSVTDSQLDSRTFFRLTEGISMDTNSSTIIIQFMEYSATDKHKTILVRFNDGADEVLAIAGRFADTSGITSLQFTVPGTSFATGSTFSLYGVAK